MAPTKRQTLVIKVDTLLDPPRTKRQTLVIKIDTLLDPPPRGRGEYKQTKTLWVGGWVWGACRLCSNHFEDKMSACCSDSEASTIPGDPLIVSEGGDAADIPPPLADTQLDTDSEVVSVTDSECGEQGSIYIYI